MRNENCSKPSKEYRRLPTLHKTTSKPMLKQKSPPPKLSFEQTSAHRLQDHPQNLNQTKAHNFLNQTLSMFSPSVIMNVSDCVKKEQGKLFQNSKQFSQQNLIKSNFIKQFNPQKQNSPPRSVHLSSLTQGAFYQKDTKTCFERQEVMNLAKWIDQKLQEFNRKKRITPEEIIDYKQHILNYGLGRILDSVRKKSREEGDLLKILWENTFKIFEQVLEIISNSMMEKEKCFEEEENQARNMYDINLQIIRTQNQKTTDELEGIYEKMKKVIIWNKRLRKENKTLNIQNRIFQYRNQTYSQALEQTVTMFLKAVPEPSTIIFAKKIIEKLARQKRRKRKNFDRQHVENDLKTQAKQYVTSWLRRNGFNETDEDDYDPVTQLTNEQKFELTNIDDLMKINQVDIYEYFKLLDIGTQTNNQTKDSAAQYNVDMNAKFVSKATVTENIYKKNFEIQVNPCNFNQVSFNENCILKKRTSKALRSGQKKKSNISKFSEKNNLKDNKKIGTKENIDTKIQEDQKISKFAKNGMKVLKDGTKVYSKKQEQKNLNVSTNELVDEKYMEKDFTVISEKKSEEFNFQSDDEKNWNSDKQRVSISRLNGQSKMNRYEISKHQNNGTRGRQASFKDFTEDGLNEDQVSDKWGDPNMKQLWKAIQKKKIEVTEEKDSRLSMNFIKIDNEDYSMRILEKKLFEQVYEEGKINSSSQEKQRQHLFETVVRSRSFYKKGKVTFENSNDFEQSKETKVDLYKSYLHYKVHNNKALTEIEAEEEQKLQQINKKMAIPSNLAKAKTLAVSKEMFKQMAETCKKTKKQPPKNKQYFNNSLTSITKNISALVQDYVRQIKRERDEIQIDFQKTYYPLHTIFIDKMNWKYGLKDISQKKIKDFLQKILSFATVNQKISLFSLLFGMELDGVGTDQLLIYLKCLVYFEKKPLPNSSIHALKDNNFYEKVTTEHDIVLETIDKILKDFFDTEGAHTAKKQVLQYLEDNKFINVQKIAEILIRSLIKRKEHFKKDAAFLYKLSSKHKNIFTNFYKILKTYNHYQSLNYSPITHPNFIEENIKPPFTQIVSKHINIQVTLKEFIKRSDIIDEIYGKSISFDRFLTAFMVAQLPKEEEFSKTFYRINATFGEKYSELSTIKEVSIKAPSNLVKYSGETVKFMETVKRKWEGKTGEKLEEEFWDWSVSRTVADHVESHLKSVLGKLGVVNNQIENFFFSLEE